MKSIVITFLTIATLFINNRALSADNPLIDGQQPNISFDTKGTIRMVYGDGEKIYCLTSEDNGTSFSKPVLIATLPDMHLGNTRGPQIASSKNFTMITAMDKEGNIHSYQLNHLKNTWTKSASVNDLKGSAPEGLMALTADKEDVFYATWLDLRTDRKNNIYFSSFNGKTASWSPNQLVYRSPDQHVCECCRPNIYFNNTKLVISFRNWLMGSRDIYYTTSANKGKTFTEPVKSGKGTWQLNGCPMDGGGLSVSEKGIVSAAWQRGGEIFYCTENQPEQKVGTGRGVSMARYKDNTVIAWQEKNNIRLTNLKDKKIMEIGTGNSPRVYFFSNGKIMCVWEENKSIRYKSL